MPSFHWTTLKHMYIVITNDYQTHCNSLYTYHAILIYYPPKKKKKKEKGVKKKRENDIPFEAYESRIQKRSINITDKKKKVGAKKGGKKKSVK